MSHCTPQPKVTDARANPPVRGRDRGRSRPLAGLALTLALSVIAAPCSAQDRTLRLERIVTDPTDPRLESAIGDLLDLREGDAIDAERLIAARRRLARSGWFEQVEVSTQRGSETGRLLLRVDGALDRRPRLITGFGHDPLDSWYLNLIGVRAHHLAGGGSRAQLAWQVGPRQNLLHTELEAPRALGSRADLLVRLRAGTERWNVYDDDILFQQPIHRSSVAIGGRLHHGSGRSTTLWVGTSTWKENDLEQADEGRDEVDPPDGLVEAYGDRAYTGDLGLDLTLDRRDLVQPWRRGSWTQLHLDGSLRDGGRSFARARFAFRGATALPGERALALRIDARWADRSTPYHLRPWFGGTGSVRGFRDASLSGGRGARAAWSAALEYRTPILPRGSSDARVHGAVFVDTGSWIDADGELGTWSTGVGWGLRIRLPWIERFSIDVGVPLTPTATDDPFWVHSGLGFGF